MASNWSLKRVITSTVVVPLWEEYNKTVYEPQSSYRSLKPFSFSSIFFKSRIFDFNILIKIRIDFRYLSDIMSL